MGIKKFNMWLFGISFSGLIAITLLGIIDQRNNNIISISINGFNLQAIISILIVVLFMLGIIISLSMLVKER